MAAEQTAAPSAIADSLGTGRRKTAVARVRVRPGSGNISINKRPLEDYFHNERDRGDVLAPLVATGHAGNLDILVKVHGGGVAAQAGAIKLGSARALLKHDPSADQPLREQSLLTRDGRMKERKKYGLRGARRGTQFSKR
jgi:small subunit ribosomal protein S9